MRLLRWPGHNSGDISPSERAAAQIEAIIAIATAETREKLMAVGTSNDDIVTLPHIAQHAPSRTKAYDGNVSALH